ncbi:MAG TPA: bifunctional tetrahydrofolate synthase/dihydrofolate synthase [Gammaproteobacteria bacterium]|nr:bifunctional tetrahydrofolate synthase/dihydrofolate synthase [Gammaproteobacteria bacterium]
MRFRTLQAWLSWQERLHPRAIDLGLERVRVVQQRLGLQRPPFLLITVAGTNGKGSCVALLEAVLVAAGYRVGAYTSPHLLRYNERVRVAGAAVSDDELCAAFERIDRARGAISLTYFEFGTLAAMDIFFRAGLDVAILEVGLGGRLDATNAWDADLALISTVDVDHSAWLGPDREAIGREKAGIMRPWRPVVLGETAPPASVLAHAAAVGAQPYSLGRDFGSDVGPAGWGWWGPGGHGWQGLPEPLGGGAVQRGNAAAVLMALTLLAERCPVGVTAVREGLAAARLRGRAQCLDGAGLRWCDVAHNPQAARALAARLRELPCAGRRHAVLGMLADKDAAGVVAALADEVDGWHAAGLAVPRGLSGAELAGRMGTLAAPVSVCENVAAALEAVAAQAGEQDRIIVVGSFYTVSAALRAGRVWLAGRPGAAVGG